MSFRWEEQREQFQSLRVEYSVVSNHWRFSQGLRFVFLGVAATAFSGLFSAYRLVLLADVAPTSTVLDDFFALLVPFVGLLLSLFADAMERAIEHMLTAAVLRGRMVEHGLGIKDGIFGDIGTGIAVKKRQFTVPKIMRFVFTLSHLIWTLLFGLAAWVIVR